MVPGERCGDTYWRWSLTGLLRLGDVGGGCVTSTSGRDKITIKPCQSDREDQLVEAGVELEVEGQKTITPISAELYRERAESRRTQELEAAFLAVSEVLAEIREMRARGELSRQTGHRRAAVFYVDRGTGFLPYIAWWLHAWKLTGLNSSAEMFDLVLFSHPESVVSLPAECREMREEDPELRGGGRCLYRALVPFSERNIKYYNHLNSLECLYNNQTSAVLRGYRTLLRADLDTLPTPRMVGLWPRDMIAHRGAGTTFNLESIEAAIRKTAAAAGIEHHHWHNIDSSIMGPSIRVIMVAKLTTAVARFTRAHMFGPGTVCKCPTCTELPQDCRWGKGIYAGTLLMYAQEIAMNELWSQREFDLVTFQILDGNCEDQRIHLCKSALLHARHNTEPFSKFAFLAGKYSQYDMAELDITNARDWFMFNALHSAGQGLNADKAWKRFVRRDEGPLKNFCKY